MVYGGATGGVGALVTGPPAAAANSHTLQATVAGVNRGVNISLSTGVSMVVASEAIVAATNPRASSFLIVAKHLNGNTYYGQDSDSTALYIDFLDGSNGTVLVPGNLPAPSTQGADEFAATNGPSGVNWTIK